MGSETTCAHAAGCGCADAGETFRMTGTPSAVGDALVRLADLGWRIHTQPVPEADASWRVQVTRPDRRA